MRLGTAVPQVIKKAIFLPVHNEINTLKKTTTGKEMAKLFGISESMVSRILTGDYGYLSSEVLIKIAEQLNIEITITSTVNGVETVTNVTK